MPECLACNHPAHTRRLLCTTCTTRIPALLNTLRSHYPRLNPHPTAGGGDGGRPPGGYASRPPLRIDVLTITTPPRHAQQPRPLRYEQAIDPDSATRAGAPALVALAHWADQARADDLLPELAGPRTVAGECLRLAGIPDQLAARWWVGDMLRDLAGVEHRILRALGEEPPAAVPIGWCPRIRDTRLYDYEQLVDHLGARLADQAADGEDWRCGGTIRARLTADHAACSRCQHRWRGDDVLAALGEQLGGAHLDLPGLVRYLDDVTVPGLRQWAHRDGWRRERVGRRTVYNLADARASWWARRGAPGVAVTAAA